jgi:uncharacterized membrane protein (UPF0182 family)
MRTPADLPRRLPRTSRRFRIGLVIAIVLIIVGLTSLRGLARFYTDYLWFNSVHFTSVFRGVLLTKWLLAIVFTALFFIMMLVNLSLADRFAPAELAPGPQDDLVVRYREVVRPHGRLVRVITAIVFALFAGVGANSQWNNWDLFRYHVSFGVKDPEFGRDVGFYVFQLPFIKFLLNWSFYAIVVVLIVVAVASYLNGGIRFQGPAPRVSGAVKTHVSVLLGLLALVKAVDYYFERLELVLSNKHLVAGATATGVHANEPALVLLMAIAVIAAGLFLFNIRQRGWTLPAVAVALWLLVWILVGAVYPALYQALRVNPSEITRETPYIQRNITATRTAYGLDKVQVEGQSSGYNYSPTITTSQISGNTPQAQANEQTISNVRLLDPNQLRNTFDKLQALRTYYQFNGLDSDRYSLSPGAPLTATITSVRELNNQVPSGFVNQHLEYTHGYGAVVAPASQQGVNQSDGTPNFSLSGLPSTGAPTLSEQGSQVYYGEGSQTNGYVIADSKQPELDYESNNGSQVSTHYTGTGGVQLGNIFRRAAFALRFGDINPILSGQVTSSSRIMYYRNISQMVRKAAPFLKYDSDPYAVILNGRIYWVQDAYTTTANYPYSQPANTDRVPAGSGLASKFNYVRNSVKVVIDAYNGKMWFFTMPVNDPIIKVYERAFPDLFTDGSQADKIIPGITAHWRYPTDLFDVQGNMYGRYHLTDPTQFYTQAQAWTISQDPGSGPLSQSTLGQTVLGANGQPVTVAAQRLAPEYILAHPAGSTQQSFEILQSFVPVSPSDKQQNLTAYMTATMDPNDFGAINVYETPPGLSVDGPALITNAIRSNTTISTQLTLLNQQGSTVELGQVYTVPIDRSLLFVQPVYVESSSNQVPELKDVVVVYNGTAYSSQGTSLDAALCNVKNSDGSQPFNMYCNTAAALGQSTLPNTPAAPSGSGTKGGSTSTTTAPRTTAPSTTAPPVSVAPGQTVTSLLNAAQQEFAAANQALKNGDLATYQKDVNLAESYVAQAQQLQQAGGSSTTTTPTSTPTISGSTTPGSTTAGSTSAGSAAAGATTTTPGSAPP